MNNVPLWHNELSENNKPISIQREEAIVASYTVEIDLLREMMRTTRDDSLSIMNIWHHLWNALCLVCGDEEYGVVWLDEWDYLINVLRVCNEKILNSPTEKKLSFLQDIVRVASLFKTTPWNQNDFYWSRQLLEKIFDIAWIDKTPPESEKTIMFFSKMERQ